MLICREYFLLSQSGKPLVTGGNLKESESWACPILQATLVLERSRAWTPAESFLDVHQGNHRKTIRGCLTCVLPSQNDNPRFDWCVRGMPKATTRAWVSSCSLFPTRPRGFPSYTLAMAKRLLAPLWTQVLHQVDTGSCVHMAGTSGRQKEEAQIGLSRVFSCLQCVASMSSRPFRIAYDFCMLFLWSPVFCFLVFWFCS